MKKKSNAAGGRALGSFEDIDSTILLFEILSFHLSERFFCSLVHVGKTELLVFCFPPQKNKCHLITLLLKKSLFLKKKNTHNAAGPLASAEE